MHRPALGITSRALLQLLLVAAVLEGLALLTCLEAVGAKVHPLSRGKTERELWSLGGDLEARLVSKSLSCSRRHPLRAIRQLLPSSWPPLRESKRLL